jgi:hypothetical protein
MIIKLQEQKNQELKSMQKEIELKAENKIKNII